MSCGMSMVKYILFIFNLLCALCGVLLIVLGSLLFSNVHNFADLKQQFAVQSFPVILIVLGAAIFIIAFFGCCGAIQESQCMSMTYATLLFILLVLDIALVALLLTTRNMQEEISKTVVSEAFHTASEPNSVMHLIEKEWQCCGVHSKYDYQSIIFPQSCCAQSSTICTFASSTVYDEGCANALSKWVIKYAQIIAYVALGIIGVELVGFIFACCLANHIRNDNRRRTY